MSIKKVQVICSQGHSGTVKYNTDDPGPWRVVCPICAEVYNYTKPS